MYQTVQVALADPSLFTGRDHTRVVELLAILAVASLVLWALVLLSLVVRQALVSVYKTRGFIHARRAASKRKTRSGNGY